MSGVSAIRSFCAGKKGLEIGGPSAIFTWKGKIPIYPVVGSLDACNFSGTTMWEGSIAEGNHFRFHPKKAPGFQYISEASDLSRIGNEQYDFVLASHVLEHCANPIKALREWVRVLKNDGLLLLILPHRDGTFDHQRKITPLDHLLWDHQHDTQESDETHMQEFIDTIDLSMTAYGSDRKTFEERTQKNIEYRGMHHHVFDTPAAIQLADQAALQIENVQTLLPFHIVIVARKQAQKNNDQWLQSSVAYKRKSPFASDRARIR
ncbi:MAG: methyltransferase domain-containing protein [Bacteroidota bacterium]